MFGFELFVSACLVSAPNSCIDQKWPFDAENDLPTHCVAFANTVLPDFVTAHPDYRIRYGCRRAKQYSKA